MARLSVIIPSRDERFLIPTIHDVFRNASQEIEVIAVLDSDKWPEGWKEITDQYPNLHTIHNGTSKGMRHAINVGVASAISRGAKFIMKSDGHCSFSEGFDEVLKAECEPNWVVVPRRGRLDPENWVATETSKPDIDYHYLSFPDNPSDWGGKGLNGKPWPERAIERKDILLDEEMSSQGSCWFMQASYFEDLLLMDEISYGSFWNEFQEIGLKCWLSGGKVMVNKKAKYLHLHKGTKYGRGYKLAESQLQQGASFTKNWIYNDAWLKQTLPFSWLIEHFWPVPSWPTNWEEILYATRKPRLVGVGSGDSGTIGGVGDNRKDVSDVSLKIYKAHYGVGSLEDIDVTKHLQALVKNDSLDIIVNNSTLTPNSNPFRGKKKQLNITYGFDGTRESITRTVEEKDWLIIGPVAKDAMKEAEQFIEDTKAKVTEMKQSNYIVGTQPIESLGAKVAAEFLAQRDRKDEPVTDTAQLKNHTKKVADWIHYEKTPLDKPSMSATALNDYLIRRFQVSPQRLRGPMPIELRDFHRNDLAQLFAELGFKRGAEIGVAEGNYSEVLLKANPECELLLVDPWHAYSDNPQNKSPEKNEYAYNEAVRKVGDYPHVKFWKMYSMDAVRDVDEDSLDFCYIDGAHSFNYVLMDIICWSQKVRHGGIIALDDYFFIDRKRWGAGVVEAVQAFTSAHQVNPWFICDAHRSVDAFWVNP